MFQLAMGGLEIGATLSPLLEVISIYIYYRRQVIMCGDGCNDCGALKTAHAGIVIKSLFLHS